jgi:hypothetical protein
MFHATAMGASYEEVFEPLRQLLGCRVMHLHADGRPGIERRGGMTWIADNSIEIGEPYGETSPVRRFIDRFGGGMHSVAVQVDDVDDALEHAASVGVRVADRPITGVAFTRPADADGLLIEWNHNRQDDDPRWGATLAPEPRSLLDPEHFAWVGAVVEDPAATAQRLGDMFGTGFVMLEGSGRDDSPAAMIPVGDCSIALFPMPDREPPLWGMHIERPRFVAMAVTVGDVDAARRRLEGGGYKISSRLADGSLVIHGQRLPFPIVVADGLLPGDPR